MPLILQVPAVWRATFLTPSYVEQRMLQHKTMEIEFDEIVDVGSDKRVAAAAFYNCLSKLRGRDVS